MFYGTYNDKIIAKYGEVISTLNNPDFSDLKWVVLKKYDSGMLTEVEQK